MGFVLVYYFWPRTIELPQLGTIEDPQLTSISGKEFQFSTTKPKLVAFFYTSCPDVCPMTIMDLTKLQEKLQNEGVGENQYEVILITLDPEDDTVEKINQYKSQFKTNDNWFFLRGTVEETKEITDQFNMVFNKDSSGFITHSTIMYLLDENNRIRAYHDMNIGKNAVNLDELVENILILLH